MQYFLFLMFFSLFVLYQNIFDHKKINLYIFYFFVFIVALALGLRGNSDEYTRLYLTYPSLIDLFSEENNKKLHEKGFLFSLIVATLKSFELSSQSLFIFFCFSSIFLNALFIRKYTDFYFLAFLFYLSHGLVFKEWNGLRMGLASVLVLPMIYYLNQEKKIKFFILAVSATLIQYIGILSLFLIFLNRRFNRTLLLFGLFFTLILYKFNAGSFIVDFFLNNNLIPNFANSYFKFENIYIYEIGLNHIKIIQQLTVIVLLIFFFGSNKCRVPKYYDLLFNTYYFGTLLMIFFSSYALLAFRINGHFYSVEPILLTFFILLFRQKKIIATAMVFVALGVAYINYVIYSKVAPYIFLIKNAQ